MRFERLRLSGFKSFVDPVELEIAAGLTGVVGPNGCGKSNLLEALRWVMGETRPTAMRGQGMNDVIFAGAAGRAARPHAEVTLMIDNADRLAPAAFNDRDTLEVTRRITRDAGSAWQANGREVRARDVAVLFADAATGAHSPALVRQGQIATLIAAGPASRRRILEDAAGIGGLHHRRHEAELRLGAAEANLARLADTVEALAAQLTALARQSRAAARYREIGAALRAAEERLALGRWQAAVAAREEAVAALRAADGRATVAGATAVAASARRVAASEALPPLREEATIAAALVERARLALAGLADRADRARRGAAVAAARLAQVDRDAAREAALSGDAAAAVARLEAEVAALVDESARPDPVPAADAAAARADSALQQAEAAAASSAAANARAAAAHDAARREAEATGAAVRRAGSARDIAFAARASARDALAAAEAGHADALLPLDRAQHEAAAAEAACDAAEAALAAIRAREADARAALSEAEGARAALHAEAAALDRMIARDTGDGQLIDAVRVAPGYAAALGAALSDDLRASETGPNGATGWVRLPAPVAAVPLPDEAEALADHVTAPAVLARRLAAVGIVPRHRGAALQADLAPGQRLVSREGDLWRWDGFRTAAEDVPSAAALRLEQLGRRETVKRDLSQATAVAEGAAAAHRRLAAKLADLTAAEAAARAARRRADDAVAAAGRAAGRAEAARTAAQARAETAAAGCDTSEAALADAVARDGDATAALKAAPAPDAAPEAAARAALASVRAAAMTARRDADALRAASEARHARAARAAADLAGWRDRAGTAADRTGDLERRRAEAVRELARAEAAPGRIADEIASAQTAASAAAARLADADAAVARADAAARDAAEAERTDERAAAAAREARAVAEARARAATEAADAASAAILEALDVAPAALAALHGTSSADLAATEAEVHALRRQRDALGAVNLRAEQDATDLRAEHDTLVAERADLTGAIDALRRGIATLNREGRDRLLTAFDEVNGHFGLLFRHLFGGGTARLEMVDSDDPLDAGLEILCQPPGKALAHLGLLSGGEQTLCAMALIFAVFLANPAPICVLDEVDAPLDDANVTRFCEMLDEMTRRTDTRFLVITHHAVTMARMDRLYGVTMGEPGVSQLVSVDLRAAERLVA